MYMIEIKEDTYDEIVENVEKMLRYGGKVMSCLDGMRSGRMGQRIPDYRDGWRERDEDDYEERHRDRFRGRY